MHIVPILPAFSLVILPSLGQDTWPISPLNIAEFNSLGLITLTPLTTGPAPTLATPTGVANPHVASSCTAVPWTIRQVAAFTADPTDEVVDYSHIEFYFNDPNANLESYCERDLPHGVGQVRSQGGMVDLSRMKLTTADPITQQSPIDEDHWYPCYNYGMSFLYAGTTMGLRRDFDCNG